MLYITTTHKREFTWHVGNKVPELSPDLVAEIQADGHELEHIRKLFTNTIILYRQIKGDYNHQNETQNSAEYRCHRTKCI